VTTQTTRFHLPPIAPAAARTRALARDARPPRLAAALPCVLALCAAAASARTPHAHKADKAVSAPTTEQILAPSAATVPDALPPDRRVFRCGSSYSAHPCPDADAAPLDVADTRSEAQRRQSEDIATRDKRLAAWYEAGRRQRELVASAPTTGTRAAAGPPACVDTVTMRCVPKKPRRRAASPKGASRAVLAGKAGN
jgi:hypothetical protein